MSSYALFQWWLLLSQHPGCYCALTPFHTELGFGDLSCRSGLFPFRRRSLAPAVSLTDSTLVAFAVDLGLVTSTWPLAHAALYLHQTITGGCTSIHFGENQLSPRSVGISPLSTTHPPVLQHWWVRASTTCYSSFTLVMDSSRGFGSHRRNCRPF